jgi:hypothetical protein
MIDLVFLTHNRLEFTRMSLAALIHNTDWSKVRDFHWYDDASTDGTVAFYEEAWQSIPVDCVIWHPGTWGNPVAVMNEYLKQHPAEIFCKVDNDILLPWGWLNEALAVMDTHPELDILGLEAFDPVVEGTSKRGYRPCVHIGGVGLMRSKIFDLSRPAPWDLRYGFTDWQMDRGDVVKGWMTPAIPMLLMDRLPYEPWKTLTSHYVAMGWAREWPRYRQATNGNLWPWIERMKLNEPAIIGGAYQL